MREVVFDIETTSSGVGLSTTDLDLAVIAIYDSESGKYSSYVEGELPLLWPTIERADVLIGFNSDSFDIPILNKYYPGDLGSIKSLDLLEEVRESLGKRIKLEKIAQGTLGKGKIGHGLDSVEWWQAGEIEKVKKYCIEDVRITKEIYDYALANGEIKYKEGNEVLPVKLDTADWRKKADSSLTHTLPF